MKFPPFRAGRGIKCLGGGGGCLSFDLTGTLSLHPKGFQILSDSLILFSERPCVGGYGKRGGGGVADKKCSILSPGEVLDKV